MARPPYPLRVLRMATPAMRGDDVKAVQRRLGITPNGVYAATTGAAVKSWKWRVGYPEPEVNDGIGPAAQLVMLGHRRRTPAMIVRTRARRKAGQLDRFKPPPPAPTYPDRRIIERDEWGAAAVTGYNATRWPDGVTLWVHYTAGPMPEATFAAETAEMRRIQAFHRGPARGWLDIGYHFVVGPSGRIYRGRPAETFGAHRPGANGEPGVCVMLGEHEKPTAAQLDAVRWLRENLNAGRLRGHRDGYPTSCPGDALAEALGL